MRKPKVYQSIRIGRRRIGSGQPTYIVAEISANHRRSFEEAADLVGAAKTAGADAVKLQTYTPDTMTIDIDSQLFRCPKTSAWAGRTLHDLYSEGYMPWEWQPRLKKVADDLGIHLFSTPFDKTAVDFLEEMDVPAYKIASFEIVDIPLVEYVASKGRPVIISTGMATLAEIEDAIGAARGSGANQLALLECTSAYPARPEDMNLRAIAYLAEAFGVPVGLSDHTLGLSVAVGGVALGACIVEKHFTLSRSLPSPDSAFSLEPHEFQAMAAAIREVEKALPPERVWIPRADSGRRTQRRSLFVVEDIKAGQVFTEANVRSIRPGHGLHPRHLPDVLGRGAALDIQRGTPLEWDMVL